MYLKNIRAIIPSHPKNETKKTYPIPIPTKKNHQIPSQTPRFCLLEAYAFGDLSNACGRNERCRLESHGQSIIPTRWAQKTSYKWSYKWVITPVTLL